MKKKIILLIITIITLLLIGGSVIGYLVSKNSSNSFNVFSSYFDNTYNFIDKQFSNNEKNINGDFEYTSNDPNIAYSDILRMIKDMDVKINFSLDKNNKKAIVDIKSSYSDEEELEIKKYYNNYSEYTYIKDNYDNYVEKILQKNLYNNFFEKLNYNKEYVMLLEDIKNALMSEKNKDYFSSVSSKTDYNGKSVNVFKNYFIIDNNDYLDIFKNMNENLKNNKEFLSTYKKVFNKDYDINDYNELINYFQNNTIIIMIYTNKITGNPIKTEIIWYENSNSVSYIGIEKINNKFEFSFMTGIYNVEGTFDIKNNYGNINASFKMSNSKDLNINLKYNINYEDKFEDVDVSNSVKYINLTDEKINEVENNLSNRVDVTNYYGLRDLYWYHIYNPAD